MSVSDEAGGKLNNRNWAAIRREYEQTTISLRHIAKKYGISFSTVSKRSMREKWSQRAKLVAKTAARLETEIDAETRAIIKDELAPWIEQRKKEITKRGYSLYDRGVSRIEHIFETTTPTDTKSESEAARAIETLVRVGRTALGMSDGNSSPGALSLNILTQQAAVQVNVPA